MAVTHSTQDVSTPYPAQRLALADALRNPESSGGTHDWAGTDPYDGLNATRVVRPLTRSVLGRRVFTLLVKRSTVNLRPLLSIPTAQSAATLAQVASSYTLGAGVHVLASDVAKRPAGTIQLPLEHVFARVTALSAAVEHSRSLPKKPRKSAEQAEAQSLLYRDEISQRSEAPSVAPEHGRASSAT
jgi:hypothetical protein